MVWERRERPYHIDITSFYRCIRQAVSVGQSHFQQVDIRPLLDFPNESFPCKGNAGKKLFVRDVLPTPGLLVISVLACLNRIGFTHVLLCRLAVDYYCF